jgi:hypothetical protein
MFVCIHNETKIDHANELTDDEMVQQWPLYELECVNRGSPWVAYQGPVPYTFPEVKNE